MAITYVCGFECGVLNTARTHINTIAGTPAFSTTTVRTGLRSLRLNPSAAAIGAGYNGLPGSGVYVLRCYINIASNPTSDAFLCGFTDGGSNYAGLVFKSLDSKVYAGVSVAGVVTNGLTGATLAAGWNLVDVRANVSANPWLIDVQIAAVALGQHSFVAVAATLNILAFGDFSTAESYDAFYDDVMCANTSGEYPIGGGMVTAHSPNRDGTHTGTGSNFVRGNAGTSIVAGTTDAFNLIDEVPMSTAIVTSDHIAQLTSSPTQYVEVGFASTTTLNAPQAISLLLSAHKATTAVGHSRWEWNDGGTTLAIQTAHNTSGSSAVFFTGRASASDAQALTSRPAGGAWTSTVFNALLLRWGYSTDATPDVYWDGAMIEAGFSSTGDGSVPIALIATGLGSLSLVGSGMTMWVPMQALGI